jgi:hypothetical protein
MRRLRSLGDRSAPVLDSRDRMHAGRNDLPRQEIAQVGWTKLSSTILRPALSNSTVSLLPSAITTVPLPNFR